MFKNIEISEEDEKIISTFGEYITAFYQRFPGHLDNESEYTISRSETPGRCDVKFTHEYAGYFSRFTMYSADETKVTIDLINRAKLHLAVFNRCAILARHWLNIELPAPKLTDVTEKLGSDSE